MIFKTLCLSTAHAPGEEALDDQEYKPMFYGDAGALYSVPESMEEIRDCDPSPWLYPILVLALKENCDYVHITHLGKIHPELKTYDWGHGI